MKTKIKICGLTREEEIKAVNLALPDYIGFVFAASRRRIEPMKAEQFRKKLDNRIIPVGVFANELCETAASIANNGIISMIQLHGNENNEYISSLKSLCNVPVIKAVLPPFDFTECCEADYFLLDSGAGSGICLDWRYLKNEIIPNIPDIRKKQIFLAGGLNSGNIKEAINIVKPYAVDVSGGAESGGVKDPEKINDLVRRTKNG